MKKEASVILAKCAQDKLYGIRIEKRDNDWVRTWAFKLKEETAKLIMIFWCLFTFITAGFEHSVANMGFLTMGLLLPHDAAVTIGGWFHNVAWVSLGNFIGGVLFVGLPYYFITDKKKSTKEAEKVA